MPFRNDDFTSRQESKIKRSWKLRRKKKRNNVDILPIINNLRVRNFSLSFREKPFLCPYEKKNSSGMGWNDNKVASKNIRKGNNNNKKKRKKSGSFDVTNEEEKYTWAYFISCNVMKLDRKETLPCSFDSVKRNTCNISLYVEIRPSMKLALG